MCPDTDPQWDQCLSLAVNLPSVRGPSTLSWVVHVGQFLKAWSPVIEVVVVLVCVRAAGGDGTQAARQRALAFIVVDQSSVVRRNVRIVVCCFKVLGETSGTLF